MAMDSTFASHPPCPIRGSFASPGTVAVPEMGLGSSDSKTELAEAREARDEARRLLRFGRNPIDVRKQDRRLSAKRPTFGEIADNLRGEDSGNGAMRNTKINGAGASRRVRRP
jgi:hypothetical protein